MDGKDSMAAIDGKAGAAPVRRSGAIGTEIPVTVHASRTSQGLGKNLPPVHEETKTVIVLPQGAVVRLTATLMPGETVVLTNRSTGADVLCRVGNVKSQPGIQHYVDLEFVQRAPGFWGPVGWAENPATAPEPLRPADVNLAAAQSFSPGAKLQENRPAVSPSLLTMPQPAAAPDSPLAAVQRLGAADDQRQPSQPAPEQVNEPAKPFSSPQLNPVTVMRPAASTPLKEPFVSAGARSSGDSPAQKGLLAAVAAVILVLLGSAGGYWFYKQQSAAQTASLPERAGNSVIPQPVAAQPSDPVTESAPASEAPPEAAPQAHTDIFIDNEPPKQPRPQFPPLSRTTSRSVTPARTRAVPIGEIKAPKAKMNPASSTSADPPPLLVGGAENLPEAAANSLLLGAGAAPPPPAAIASKPATGGQLQEPRLISSVQPVYPPTARAQRLQGVVSLDALVDETGKVVQTQVISGPIALQAAAQEAVRKWRYQPAQLNGRPISVHTRVNVRFTLQ